MFARYTGVSLTLFWFLYTYCWKYFLSWSHLSLYLFRWKLLLFTVLKGHRCVLCCYVSLGGWRRTLPLITPRKSPSISFIIIYSLIILSFDALQFEAVTASLKPTNNKYCHYTLFLIRIQFSSSQLSEISLNIITVSSFNQSPCLDEFKPIYTSLPPCVLAPQHLIFSTVLSLPLHTPLHWKNSNSLTSLQADCSS
jgi:hypothetical protein